MKKFTFLFQVMSLIISVTMFFSCTEKKEVIPLSLHPENPHYFLFRGKPTLLYGSTEHYGAVLNLDFDYVTYLNKLQATGLNLTRTFSGIYCEDPKSFGITNNTMAPVANKFICPWARSNEPGYFNGGNKFDLTKWDTAYFARLKDFISQASHRGIVVELVLFCMYYDDSQWNLSPINPKNNINKLPEISRNDAQNLKYPEYTKVQEEMVRKIVTELQGFDNVYFEICNEPYFGVSDDWQAHIAKIIVDTENGFTAKHLIAQNIGNDSVTIKNLNPAVSIINFHYAQPEAASRNYGLNKAIIDDETGFRGTFETPYRTEVWKFILAGGAGFNHLDYSYTCDKEDGSFISPASQPGWGGDTMRDQFMILKKFVEGFDYLKMSPDKSVVKEISDSSFSAQALCNKGNQYGIYFTNFTASFPENTSFRWTGFLQSGFSEEYTFKTVSDDGVRVWINNKLIIDNWTDHGVTTNQGTMKMKAGEKAKLRVEFYNGKYGAILNLSWSCKSQTEVIIPNSNLYLPDGQKNGLKLEYYSDKELKKFERTDICSEIDVKNDFNNLFTSLKKEIRLKLKIEIPAGNYLAEWLNTKTGKVDKSDSLKVTGDLIELESPEFKDDIAFRIKKKQ